MESDRLYKYIGLVAVIVFFMYVVLRTMNFEAKLLNNLVGASSSSSSSSSSLIEGFTDAPAMAKHIVDATAKIEDELLVSKYRKEYETILIDLEDFTRTSLLQDVLTYSTQITDTTNNGQTALALMTALTSKNTFINTLNDTLAILKKK